MASFQRQYVSKLVPANVTVLTVLLVLVAVANSATLGYDSSVMSGLLILPSYTEYFQLTTATTGLNNAAMWVGGILGSFVMQPVPDRFGRKGAILGACLVSFVGIALQAGAQNIAMFVAARIIIGFGTALSNMAAPLLLGELLPARKRGRILGIFFSCYYVGSLASSIVNYGSQHIPTTWAWRLPSMLQLIPSALSLVLLPLVPESPRWLISKGHEEHAQEVLVVMQGAGNEDVDGAASAVLEIKAVISKEAQDMPGNPWRELLATPGNRKRLFILVVFGSMISTLGNFVISFYLNDILEQSGVRDTNTKLQISVGLSCWCFVVAISGSFMLDVIGRRLQTLISMAGMIATLYITGGLIKIYGASDNESGIYGTIAVIFLFQGFYSFAITPMTSLYPTEIAQYKVRAASIAVFRFFDGGFGLCFSFAMAYAMAELGWRFYLINASWNIIFALIVFFFFPETRALKLEEISILFEGPQVIEAALNENSSSKDENSLPDKKRPSVSTDPREP
ncbi:Lactose permease [Diaporthe eres]|uniref:Major facilitator superfamily (MFS) profile domain-containing protein n=1 Tax=Diaporthe vaccinii TaxID=105482 RepID=A0ABR4F953_9PEZI|nr:Lactose permease [Diaporthe eres]